MALTAADMLNAAGSSFERAVISAQLAADLLTSISYQQLKYAGGIMANEVPQYVKRNAVFAAALLVPFLLAVTANTADQLVRHQTLYRSWAWTMPQLAIWVLWLPFAAATISAVTFVVYLLQRVRAGHQNLRQALFVIHYTWSLLTVLAGALFILAILFGHDSVHCLTDSPLSAMRWPQTTWHCIQER